LLVVATVADASGVTVALESGVTGVASVTGGVVGAGWGASAAGSVVDGGAVCCASSGVEESARAAAIAGRALVRA
jgi:hypothetical protein